SASPHSPSTQPQAARRHPLRLTAGLNSEETNSTKGVGTAEQDRYIPTTRELAVAANSLLRVVELAIPAPLPSPSRPCFSGRTRRCLALLLCDSVKQ
ncbi:hypothetical protein S83_001412, partial [Arachis hypogaea]